ncbi:MAG TPA: PAS domain-containing protein [Longimicrobium sp.]|nr:PAS domain-containing protein [Longimicrobium sp.]
MDNEKNFQTMLPRLQRLRAQAAVGAPEEVLDASLEELQTAVEELRVMEEELLTHQALLADAWQAAESRGQLSRALFDAAADPMLVTDALGVVREANQAAGRLLGTPADRLCSKPLSVFIPTPERREFRARMAALAREAGAARFDLRLVPRGAEPVLVEASVASFTPAGAPPGVHWAFRDVTAARQAEQSRAAAGDGALLALAALPVATVVLDVDGTVALWNAAAEELLGWEEEDVTGRRCPALGEAGERAVEAALQAHEESRSCRLRLGALTDTGGRVEVEVAALRLADEEGRARGTVLVLAPHDDSAAGRGAQRAAETWSGAEMRRVLFSAGDAGGDFSERLRAGVGAARWLGHLKVGDRLPSIRETARITGVDHRVVSNAYRRLASEGVVEIRSRHGVTIAPSGPAPEPPAAETPAWLAGVVAQAVTLHVKVPQLAELVRRWTGSTVVRCAVAESTEDALTALAAELQARWGFDTYRVPLSTGAGDAGRRERLSAELRGADVVVTTHFHAAAVTAAGRAAGVQVVVLDADHDLVAAAEERLRQGPLTALVADPREGERLRCLAGGERLRVVLADDEAAVAALDASEPVLLTRAAQQRVRRPLRLLAPVSPAFSADTAPDLATVLIRRNLRASRDPD